VQGHVDLVIEFQVEYGVAALISDKIASAASCRSGRAASHASYFGADNYRIGYTSGEALVNFCDQGTGIKVAWVLGLDVEAGWRVCAESNYRRRSNGIRSRCLPRWRSIPL